MDSDFDLLEAWSRGDSEAGNRLFHRHFDSVCWFFQNKVSENLDDLIQETFLACIESRDRFRRESSFRAFILGVANNVLRSYYRSRRRKIGKIDFGITSVHDLGPSPSLVLARYKEERLLLKALRQIPLDFQVMLELLLLGEHERPRTRRHPGRALRVRLVPGCGVPSSCCRKKWSSSRNPGSTCKRRWEISKVGRARSVTRWIAKMRAPAKHCYMVCRDPTHVNVV